MNNNHKHFDLYISGKVQGVFYRKSCKAQAIALGLFGTVENLKNGDVFCRVEGEIENIITFIDWCKEGPKDAKVLGFKSLEGKLEGYTSFEII